MGRAAAEAENASASFGVTVSEQSSEVEEEDIIADWSVSALVHPMVSLWVPGRATCSRRAVPVHVRA